ncbi:MAG: outer membrane lipoprotein-sorting protein [Verrucomicrobia bacterium]|nr:MAG: outer membrane lipoprotein-sorting protein [Verrucomicrobiota bacterium]
MIRFRPFLRLLLSAALLPAAFPGLLAQPASGPVTLPALDGPTLAAQVRWQAPTEPFSTAGVLRLRDRNGRWYKELAIRMDIRLGEGGLWENQYTVFDRERQVVESLVVRHHPGSTNSYHYLPPGAAKALDLAGPDAFIPFAGSQFWLADFGLEFLFWPEQRLVGADMRKGRACHLLESVNPDPRPGQYAIVRSWIDVEKLGLLRAEAYDEQRRLLKEFNIGGFKKVNGRWQLKSMEIRDELTDERSRLEFELEVD